MWHTQFTRRYISRLPTRHIFYQDDAECRRTLCLSINWRPSKQEIDQNKVTNSTYWFDSKNYFRSLPYSLQIYKFLNLGQVPHISGSICLTLLTGSFDSLYFWQVLFLTARLSDQNCPSWRAKQQSYFSSDLIRNKPASEAKSIVRGSILKTVPAESPKSEGVQENKNLRERFCYWYCRNSYPAHLSLSVLNTTGPASSKR